MQSTARRSVFLLIPLFLVFALAYAKPPGPSLIPSGGVQIGGFIPQDKAVQHEELPGDPYLPGQGQRLDGAKSLATSVQRGPYVSIQVNVDRLGRNIVGDAANEPSIAIDPTDPRKIVIGWRQFDTIESDFRQAGWAYSHDGGHTWVASTLDPGVFRSDPVLDSNADGDIFFYSFNPYNGGGCTLFKSVDGGVSWDQGIEAWGGDKAWMAIDRTDGIGRGNIYLTWSEILNFTRSTDGGNSVTDSLATPIVGQGTMTVAPDGALYSIGNVRVVKSTNAAQSMQAPEFIDLGYAIDDFRVGFSCSANLLGLCGQPWIASDHSDLTSRGNVYVLAVGWLPGMDFIGRVYFVRSMDLGLTWQSPVVVNDDPPSQLVGKWFAMMSVAPNGRIDAVWNDTRNTDAANLSELYYSYSVDAGDTWSTNVPVSPVFDSYLGWPDGSPKLGDYYHMVSNNLGVNVAWAATFNGEQDVYFLRIGPWDCNGNEVPDDQDIATLTSLDCNANDVPDECEYRGDFDGDALTTLKDVAALQRCFTGPGEFYESDGASGTHPTPSGATGGLPASVRSIGYDHTSASLILDPCCRLFDLDENETIDQADLPILQRVLSGP